LEKKVEKNILKVNENVSRMEDFRRPKHLLDCGPIGTRPGWPLEIRLDA
jgi:hypothetical protein